MCIIMAKARKEGKFDKAKIDFAQKSNEDGYGVMWYEDGELKFAKTTDYTGFIAFLEQYNYFEGFEAVLHLRYSTGGATDMDMCHPFNVGKDHLMMHNGSIFDLKDDRSEESDTSRLADILKGLSDNVIDYTRFLRSTAFRTTFKSMIGTSINRVVIMTDKGKIIYYNKGLGETVRGIWYSNDYYKKARYVAPNTKYAYTPAEAVTYNDLVFVYGTLKKGFKFNACLGKAELQSKGVTNGKWAMVGKNRTYPYLIEPNEEDGYNIKGEVYKVNALQMAKLDRLEGYPYHYDKRITLINTGENKAQLCWVYFNKYMNYKITDLIDEFIETDGIKL